MSANLRKRLAEIEAGFGPPAIFGIWAHQDGTPTYHRLAAMDMDLERWFRTGELPKNVDFIGVMVTPESERLWVPGPERRQPHEFIPTEEQLHEGWEPFPEMHTNTLRQFQKTLELPFYNFIEGQLRGMNGPLPPKEQRRELYPHG